MNKEKKTTSNYIKYSKSAPFYRQDVILYAIITALIVGLFLFFVIIPKSDKPQGFSVSVDNELVFTFDFSKEEITLNKELNKIVHDKENNTITVYTSNQSFNKLLYDTDSLTVKIIESNCPNHDCVDFFEISSGNGVIYCLPHGLKILPLVPSQSEPSTGGRL